MRNGLHWEGSGNISDSVDDQSSGHHCEGDGDKADDKEIHPEFSPYLSYCFGLLCSVCQRITSLGGEGLHSCSTCNKAGSASFIPAFELRIVHPLF
jgi:hypothetical protein